MHHEKTKQKRTPMPILKLEQKKLAHIKTIEFFKMQKKEKKAKN
jgi:hypothetical protein